MMGTPTEPLGDLPDHRVSRDEVEEKQRKEKPGHSLRYWFMFTALLLIAAVVVYFVAYLPRKKEQQEAAQNSRQQATATPRVQVLKVTRAPTVSELMIPGTTLAYTESYIYARASGYLSRRLVDIGDRVHQGQLLATIDAPDLDKQVSQARSALAQSESTLGQLEAQLHLASLTWDRYKVLVAKGVFSRQDGDTQEANFRVAEANLRAAQNTVQGNRDNLERLLVLQQYEQVTAPFSGVITARNVDVGALITAQGTGLGSSPVTEPGSTQAGAQGTNGGASGSLSSSVAPATGGSQGGQMFSIASLDPLRILVSVPEAYSSLVQTGERAELFFQEMPQDKIFGNVTRSSASIDQNTRTLLVEVQARNRNGRLLPGMYVVVNFVGIKGQPPLLIPGESIVVRDAKTMVAVVENNIVHFRPIEIGRDYGDQTEITRGLSIGQEIVQTVTDEVRDGVKIEPQFQQERQQTVGGQSDKQASESGQYGEQNLTNQTQRTTAGKKGGSGKGGNSGQKKQ